MNDISSAMKVVYQAHSVAIVPGSGTYAMEAVAREFGKDKKCLVIRNGFFSFRWTQIFERCGIPSVSIVIKAKPDNASDPFTAYHPAPIEEVVKTILADKPQVVFAPHVETSSGVILPDDYLLQVSKAVHSVGGIFVLDCIASGTVWVDMKQLGIDVLISAPQKGWSGPACAGLVMMSAAARKLLNGDSDSFSCNLAKWTEVMEKYESGSHMYHATMPTDALATFRDVICEARGIGFDTLKQKQWTLGNNVRNVLANRGIVSVASEGFCAPGVIVCYSTRSDIVKAFQKHGIQIAGGVPLKCDEPEGFSTFRLGLFGIDKLCNISETTARLEKALDSIFK